MAFFYEAEQPVWKYKQRYKSWVKFGKSETKSLEKLYQNHHNHGDNTVTMQWRNPDSNSEITLDIAKMSGQGSSYYHSQFELSREGYPYPDAHAKHTPDGPLVQIFDKFQDPDDTNCMDEDKIHSFFGELKINMESDRGPMQLFILHAMCEANEIYEIERPNFLRILKKCGCSTYQNIIDQIYLIENEMFKFGNGKSKKICKNFARWLFKFSSTEAKAKSILFNTEAKKEEEVQGADDMDEDEEEDTPLVQVVFQTWVIDQPKSQKTFPLGPQMFDFLTTRSTTSITKDSLVNIIEFMMTFKSAQLDEEELYNWPLIIGEFCEWAQK